MFCTCFLISLFFFFNDTATTEIYTLSLHDALPIFPRAAWSASLSVGLLAAKCPSSCATQYPRESSVTYRSLSVNTLRLGRCVNMALVYPAGTLRRNILVVSMYFQCGTKRTRRG